MSETLTGAQALIRALELEGVDTIFGVPGGAILPAYDPILDSPIRHVLARHEQGAGHMASGYAHASGRVGVAMATSGPGATNLITALQDAFMDSIPLVAVTGQVGMASIGYDAFQEAHTWGISMPCTKHNYLVTEPEAIADAIHEAFHLASTGRPGPVLVDVPKNMLNASLAWRGPGKLDLPGYRPSVEGHPKQVKAAVRLIAESERPVLYLGRRGDPGECRRRGAPLRRAGQPARGHHADGPRRHPRLPPTLPGDAGHARQLHGDHRHATAPICSSPSAPVSTTGSPATSPASPPTPR